MWRKKGALEKKGKEKGGNDLNAALVNAAYKGDASTLRRLVSKGANVNSREKRTPMNYTALMIAARLGHNAAVRALVDMHARLYERNKPGHSALTLAVAKGHVDVIKTLLHAGACLGEKNKDRDTVLLWAARCGQPDLVRTLIAAGASLEKRDNNGKTALQLAIQLGRKKTAEILALATATERSGRKCTSVRPSWR